MFHAKVKEINLIKMVNGCFSIDKIEKGKLIITCV